METQTGYDVGTTTEAIILASIGLRHIASLSCFQRSLLGCAWHENVFSMAELGETQIGNRPQKEQDREASLQGSGHASGNHNVKTL